MSEREAVPVKKWKIASPDSETIAQLCREQIPPLAAHLMAVRGIAGIKEARGFLQGAGGLSDPFLLRDMDKAAEIINKAIEKYDRICIYGDYDCDGVTATSILFTYLESMGADVCYYIPEREERYGMNIEAVHKIAALAW